MTPWTSLSVDVHTASYPIYFGNHLLTNKDLWRALVANHQTILIVSNETVAPLYLNKLQQGLPSKASYFLLPDGEQYKTWSELNTIFDAMMAAQLDRGSLLIALGGGVVGDMVGFAGACYMRGIHFIQVPTTLLAQVDSSIGGKTAINHPLSKNLIGAFHQPKAVVIDLSTLLTLPEREYVSGLAEIIKIALICDLSLFEYLEHNTALLLQRDEHCLQQVIYRACELKAAIVQADEKEQGQRALLNLGHTFAHAIEQAYGYGTLLHGEAVAIGLVKAALLSTHLTGLSYQDYQRIIALISQLRLPTALPKPIACEQFLQLMSRDKKVQQGRLRLILLKAMAQAVIVDDISPQDLMTVLS